MGVTEGSICICIIGINDFVIICECTYYLCVRHTLHHPMIVHKRHVVEKRVAWISWFWWPKREPKSLKRRQNATQFHTHPPKFHSRKVENGLLLSYKTVFFIVIIYLSINLFILFCWVFFPFWGLELRWEAYLDVGMLRWHEVIERFSSPLQRLQQNMHLWPLHGFDARERVHQSRFARRQSTILSVLVSVFLAPPLLGNSVLHRTRFQTAWYSSFLSLSFFFLLFLKAKIVFLYFFFFKI